MSTSSAARDDDLVIRLMRSDEFEAMRDLSVSAFADDPSIRVLLDDLRESWAWEDELSFVAEQDGELVGQVLYTHAFLDAPSGSSMCFCSARSVCDPTDRTAVSVAA